MLLWQTPGNPVLPVAFPHRRRWVASMTIISPLASRSGMPTGVRRMQIPLVNAGGLAQRNAIPCRQSGRCSVKIVRPPSVPDVM